MANASDIAEHKNEGSPNSRLLSRHTQSCYHVLYTVKLRFAANGGCSGRNQRRIASLMRRNSNDRQSGMFGAAFSDKGFSFPVVEIIIAQNQVEGGRRKRASRGCQTGNDRHTMGMQKFSRDLLREYRVVLYIQNVHRGVTFQTLLAAEAACTTTVSDPNAIITANAFLLFIVSLRPTPRVVSSCQ